MCDRFGAGDVVMMRPCNSAEDVEQFCQLLKLNPDSHFVLTPTDNNTGVWVCVGVSRWLCNRLTAKFSIRQRRVSSRYDCV